MTTTQTHQTLLTPSTRSAGIVRSRAEFPSQSAADAPGFAGVLEAFAEPIEDTQLDQESQTSNDADQSESQDPENADQSEKTEQSSADDTQANTQNTPVEGSAAEGAPSDLVPDADKSINSTADLESLLTNAAAIDLATLASQQLQASPPTQPIERLSESSERNGLQAGSPKQGEGSIDSEGARKPSLKGFGNPKGPATTSVTGDQGSAVTQGKPFDGTAQPGVPKAQPVAGDPTIQAQPVSLQRNEAQQASEPAKVFTAQVAQVQASDRSGNARRLQSIRSVGESPITDSVSRTISGSEAAGKQGTQDPGVDLGNKSQTAAKLMQSDPADDRAMQRQQVLAQVQRGLASILNTKGGTMKIRLTPEHLGEVNIQLSTKDGRVNVQIQAKNESTRSMLSEGLEGLRSDIEARGAIVDKLQVDGQHQTSFERLFGQAGESDLTNDDRNRQQHEPDSQNQTEDHADHESQSGDPEHHSHQPQEIWTELGLDAIA